MMKFLTTPPRMKYVSINARPLPFFVSTLLLAVVVSCHHTSLPAKSDDSDQLDTDSESPSTSSTLGDGGDELNDSDTVLDSAQDSAQKDDTDTSATQWGPNCGDGITNQEWEQCDDGNVVPGDGANGLCQIEPFFMCDTAAAPCTCESTTECGNGIREPGEACDDGNLKSLDGCDVDCETETGFLCRVPAMPCEPLPICGDGKAIYRRGEQCDDGNVESGDGCSANCTSIEDGFECSQGGGQCVPVPAECGNGLLEWNEECDDRNGVAQDGCDAACAVEAGYLCPFHGAPCIATCGDGIVTASEFCDDGNIDNTDDCSNQCQFTDATACKHMVDSDGGTINECIVPVCGNGIVEPGEQCDDGADNSPDAYNGCTEQCTLSPRCGDGIINGGEQCDNGDNATVYGVDASDACAPNCRLPAFCGDGVVQPWFGEQCDDSNGYQDYANGYGECTADCQAAPFCGDGVITPEYEICDIGANTPFDATVHACLNCTELPSCGDGIVQEEWGEQCDDGPEYGVGLNIGNRIKCGPGCIIAMRCGDGKVQEEYGEECDNGDDLNTGHYGECGPDCKLGPRCGDLVVQEAHEECDDGYEQIDLREGDGCTNSCAVYLPLP